MKVPVVLYKAQRQYRHNYGSEELLPSFDFEETIKIVNELGAKIKQLQNKSSNSEYMAALEAIIKEGIENNYAVQEIVLAVQRLNQRS